MSKKFFTLFQIGPVQEFIATARKTQDFWSGSFLLSYLSVVAMRQIAEEAGAYCIVFPSISNSRLFSEFSKAKLPLSPSPPDSDLRSTIPNRFFAILEDTEPVKILSRVAETVEKRWAEVAGIVRAELEEKLNDVTISEDETWKSIWKRQIAGFFETLYVWHPWDGQDTTYGDTYRKTEALMGARKGTRWFGAGQAEPGHKCSLCGVRQALCTNSTGSERRDVREFWKSRLRNRKDLQFRFADGEHLCAVCTTKRLAPALVFRKDSDVPSTSTVAVSDFVRRIGEQKALCGADVIRTFVRETQELAKALGEPVCVDAIPFLEGKYSKTLGSFVNIDGDWLYEQTYDRLIAKERVSLESARNPESMMPTTNGPSRIERLVTAKKALRKLSGSLKSVEKDRYRPPTKYLCVLMADADDMGSVLAGIGNARNHKELSGLLGEFASVTAPSVLNDSHLGYVVYFGGDEGIAFVALEDVLKAMRGLRAKWESEVMQPFAQRVAGPGGTWEEGAVAPPADVAPPVPECLTNRPTLSVGVVIAHHQHGLRSMIGEASKALAFAKESDQLDKKDAFCVRILRRSGSPVHTRAKWVYSYPDSGIDVIEVLSELQDAYRQGTISARWVYDLRSEETALSGKGVSDGGSSSRARKLRDQEIKRLLRRHISAEPPSSCDVLVDELLSLHQAICGPSTMENPHAFKDFIGLMDLTSYIAKGGGW